MKEEIKKLDDKSSESSTDQSNPQVSTPSCEPFTFPDSQNITFLNLYNKKVSIGSLLKMAAFDWSHLIKLQLGQNKFGDLGCKFLTKIPLPVMETFELQSSQIGNEGVGHLTKSEWKQLKHYSFVSPDNYIDKNRIGMEGAKKLSKNNWKSLQKLYIQCNQFNVEAVKQLTLYECNSVNIIWLDLFRVQSKNRAALQQMVRSKFPLILNDMFI